MPSIENKEKELAEHQEEMFRRQLAAFKKSKEYRLVERISQKNEIAAPFESPDAPEAPAVPPAEQ